jgi:hypothetical protein
VALPFSFSDLLGGEFKCSLTEGARVTHWEHAGKAEDIETAIVE